MNQERKSEYEQVPIDSARLAMKDNDELGDQPAPFESVKQSVIGRQG